MTQDNLYIAISLRKWNCTINKQLMYVAIEHHFHTKINVVADITINVINMLDCMSVALRSTGD